MMKLVVGLGNVGDKYLRTRHNVGFKIIDQLALFVPKSENRNTKQISNFNIQNKFNARVLKMDNTIIAKPMTYMNESGVAVASLATYYKIHAANIYIIHDDLDIKLGEYKIQRGKGPREHNGLLSIYNKLGTKDFWHVRVGIENRSQQIRNTKSEIQNKSQITDHKSRKKIPGEDYVLMNFENEELNIIEKVVGNITDELISLIK